MPTATTARTAQPDELDEVAELIDQSIGQGSTNAGELRRAVGAGAGLFVLADPDPTGLLHLLRRRINGAILVQAVHAPQLRDLQIGLITFLAIKASQRGRGLSAPLVAAGVEWALTARLDLLAALAWESSNAVRSVEMLSRAGFSRDGSIELKSVLPGRSCPSCAPSSCLCSALLMTAPLSLPAWTAYKARKQPGG